MVLRRCVAFVLVILPRIAAAQAPPAGRVPSFEIQNRPPPIDASRQAQDAGETSPRALMAELALRPFMKPSGGFTYRFDPDLGTVVRTSRGFAPLFVERASSMGRGYGSVSIVVSGGSHAGPPEDPVIMRVRTETAALLASYGMTDRLDLGMALPLTRVVVSDGQRRSGSVGVGDLAVRSKMEMVRRPTWGLAASGDLSLPVGDSDALGGSAGTALRGALIVSAADGPIEAHANAGFFASDLTNQFVLGGAVSAAAAARVTLSAEALMRYASGAHTAGLVVVGGARWNPVGTWLLNSCLVVPVTDTGPSTRAAFVLSIEYAVVP